MSESTRDWRSGPGAAAEADARGTERCPDGLRASWRLLAAGDARFTPAAVCNVSPTGVALLLGEAVRPGAILVVRLEGLAAPAAAPRLAHVKHATAQADGHWLVGCAFATPLAEDAVAALNRPAGAGAGPAPAAVASSPAAGGAGTEATWMAEGAFERRTAPPRRVPLVRVVLWEVRGGARSQGWVANVSRGGLGLVALRSFPAGTAVRVRAVHAADVVPWVEVTVRSCRRKGQRWQVGCRFSGTPHPHGLGLLG